MTSEQSIKRLEAMREQLLWYGCFRVCHGLSLTPSWYKRLRRIEAAIMVHRRKASQCHDSVMNHRNDDVCEANSEVENEH